MAHQRSKRRDRRNSQNDSGTPCMSPIEGCPQDFELRYKWGGDQRVSCWKNIWRTGEMLALDFSTLHSNHKNVKQDQSKKENNGTRKNFPKVTKWLPKTDDTTNALLATVIVIFMQRARTQEWILLCPRVIICQCQLKVSSYGSRCRNVNVCEH